MKRKKNRINCFGWIVILCCRTTDLRMTRARFVNSVYIFPFFCQYNAWLRYSFSFMIVPVGFFLFFLRCFCLTDGVAPNKKNCRLCSSFIFCFSFARKFCYFYSVVHEPFTNIFMHFFVSWKWLKLTWVELSWSKKEEKITSQKNWIKWKIEWEWIKWKWQSGGAGKLYTV